MRRFASTGTSYGPMSVCVCHKSVFYRTDERIELVGMGPCFHIAYTVLKGNCAICKNKGTSLWNFVPNSRLWKFCHGISIMEACFWLNLLHKGGHSERDKLDRRQSTTLTIPQSSDSWLLVYHTNYQAVSTAWFCRAGPLATAGTYYGCLCSILAVIAFVLLYLFSYRQLLQCC